MSENKDSKGFIGNNKTAALEAGKIKLGKITLKTLSAAIMKGANDSLPFGTKGIAEKVINSPFGALMLANLLKIVEENYSDNIPEQFRTPLKITADATMVAATLEFFDKVNLEEILEKFLGNSEVQKELNKIKSSITEDKEEIAAVKIN